MDKLIGMENSRAVGFLTEVFPMKEQLHMMDFMKDIEIPRIISDIKQSVVALENPPSKVFTHRSIIIHPEIDNEKRAQFINDLKNYRRWKEKTENTKKRYIIRDNRTKEELEAEKQVQMMIMNKRQGRPIHYKEENSENES